MISYGGTIWNLLLLLNETQRRLKDGSDAL